MTVQRRLRSYGQIGLWLGLCTLVPVNVQAVPAGTLIDNTATASYNGGVSNTSNTVSITTVIVRTPAAIEFLQYAPLSGAAQAVPVAITQYSTSGSTAGPFIALPAPIPAGSATPIDLGMPVPLQAGSTFHQGEPIFLRVTDLDQNLDATTAETVVVTLSVAATGDSEVLLLTETGPNTGVFTGYIQSYAGSVNPAAATPANGQLGLQADSSMSLSYVDVADAADATASAALVDPFGLVFDSSTGQPVNGAQVTLIDDSTGLPATVYGDDGISIFPSTITSGGSAVDSGGTVYNFAPGNYRFPFVVPGTYRLSVAPPAGYNAPSSVPTAILQALPGAPFAIDDNASRGLAFVINPGPAIEIDIPVDATGSGFFLVKEVNRREAAIGDYLQYRLRLDNNSGGIASAAQIVDTLPPGLRYRTGSTTVDGIASADPAISADGRTLTFSLGDISATTLREVRYVVVVAAGTQPGDNINRATASANAGALVSNEATVSVRIKDDFLRDGSIVFGRVLVDACAAPDSEQARGLAGVRIYLEDGTFVVTDEQGMYHLEGVKPGTHVLQLDADTLAPQYAPVICDEDSRFAGRAFSRFVDLQGGSLWRADFHVTTLPPPKADVSLQINSSVTDHVVTYHLAMRGGDVALQDMRLMINLPEDSEYLPGSSVLNNRAIDDPQQQGNVLIYKLGDVPGAWHKQLNFLTRVNTAGDEGALSSQAFLMFNTPARANQRTPVVETIMKRLRFENVLKGNLSPRFDILSARLTDKDKEEIRKVADFVREHRVLSVEVIGHTDNLPISARAREQFASNFALSVARANSVGEYLITQLGLPNDVLSVHGKGATEPLAPNSTDAGRALNRRVELRIVTELMLDASRLSDITTLNDIEVSVEGAWKKLPVVPRKTTPEDVRQPVPASYDKAWVEAAAPGLEWLWPQADYNPPIPSIKIAIKHDPAHKLALYLNDKPLSALNFSGYVKNQAGTVAVSQWSGVDIDKGHNELRLEVRDADGQLVQVLSRDVQMTLAPVRAELVTEHSQLVADGKQPPVIAVRLYDKDDRPVRPGTIGRFSVTPPYIAQQDIDDLKREPITGLDRGNPRYRVGEDGIALIELKPTTRTGEALIVIPTEKRDLELRAWLQPASRDWILVGLAEGTVGHNTVSGNLQSLEAAGLERDSYSDGKLTFFAKGSIKGEWLLTLAYDSENDQAQERERLFQEIDPDTYYPVYGDNTTQGYDAASTEKLYVRVERNQFYAMFGDYTTGLSVTELTRYDRSMTGFKSEINTGMVAYNLFASETAQNFRKDEIRGNGTSGLYRLRYNELVQNSEKVVIETRDRFRSEVILSSQPLTRHLDYSIDYASGTLYFRSPIASRDASLNPIYIVVDYETLASGAEQWTYGGRGALRVLDETLEIGASYINEGQQAADNNLTGIDAKLRLGAHTELRAEIASSQTGNNAENDATYAELQHISGQLDGSVYYRETEAGFGLGQMRGSEDGTEKYGVDGRYYFTDKIDLNALAYHETNLQTSAEREVLEAGLNYKEKDYGFNTGLRTAQDSYTNGTQFKSEQLTVGAYKSVLDNSLRLRFNHDQSLSDNANPDYPTRTVLGADYQLNTSTSLFLEQEFTHGDNAQTQNTRIGMAAQPWTGAALRTSLEQQTSEYGPRVFANAGLRQTWQVSEHWSIDAGIDRSKTVKEPAYVPFNVNAPPASGDTEDFTAVSVGASYRHTGWTWTSRIEHRDADSEDKWGIYSSVTGEPSRGLGLSARLQVFDSERSNGEEALQGDLRLGLVYRPFARRWTFLNRADFVMDEQSGGLNNYDIWKLVNNLVVNYRVQDTQISTHYGAKYVRDTIDALSYSGYTDHLGIEVRHDLDKRWDIGARASLLRAHEIGNEEYSYGLAVGYNPATNLWLNLGYNWAGYDDPDFALAGYTASGVYLRFDYKFDQQTVRDTAAWFTRK